MNVRTAYPQIAASIFALSLSAGAAQAQFAPNPEKVTGEPYNPYNVKIDPYNYVNQVVVEEGKPGKFTSERLSRKQFFQTEFKRDRKEDDWPEKKPEVVSPVLKQWLAEKDHGEKVELIITLVDTMRIPLLPRLQRGQEREGKSRRAEAIEEIRKQRQDLQERALLTLRKVADFEITGHYWLTNSVKVLMPLGAARELAKFRDVTYIQPVEGGEKPPADGNNNNDPVDARAVIRSDPYFNLGLTTPWIGLLDTGVRESHQMFKNPDHIAWMRDCVNGGTFCNQSGNPGYDPSDFAWNHGTSSAGILVGNHRLGNAFRGVTEIRMDSWQIYTAGGLHTDATKRAFEAAVAAFDKVLVGELQANESDNGGIALAADAAYDAGAIVVSANGNFGPAASTVRSPGIAHKVIGVGAFDTDGGAQYGNQGRGPAPDNRYKPDIQAPTRSETASATSDNDLRVFCCTSGATPYAAAVAMLARNWLHQFGSVDNGQTYAFMILYGQDPYPYNNTVGAGRLKMATNGHAYWGKLAVGNGATIEIPISVGSGRKDFDVALWWPESQSQQHNDVDVHLIDPSGTERARGYSGPSVFERAGVAGSLTSGTWKIRIRGYNVRTGSQLVYWAAHIRN